MDEKNSVENWMSPQLLARNPDADMITSAQSAKRGLHSEVPEYTRVQKARGRFSEYGAVSYGKG